MPNPKKESEIENDENVAPANSPLCFRSPHHTAVQQMANSLKKAEQILADCNDLFERFEQNSTPNPSQ